MRTLFLDLASHSGLIACVTQDALAASVAVDHRVSDGALPALLEQVLKEAQWSLEDLTQVACVVGPGGFTSLRVALSFANTVAWGRKLPMAGIHLSDLYAARLPLSPAPFPQREKGGFSPLPSGEGLGVGALWLHSTKKQELFVRGFGRHQEQFPAATWITLEDLLKQLPEEFFWAGELIPEHEKEVAAHGGTPAPLNPLLAVLPRFISALSCEEKTLLPWYGRGW